MPAKYWEGTPYIQSTMYPPNTPSPLPLGGTAGEPFYFPTHVGRVAHLLGIGSTDSGKSTFAAVLACAILGIPDSHLTWLDLGHSSFVLAHLLGAEYHDVGDPDSTPLCPLALLDRPTGLQFLMGWFERLFFRRKEFELDEDGSKDLRGALMDVRGNEGWDGVTPPRHLRRLYTALPTGGAQRGRMRAIVDEMINSYGYIFGGEPTDATNSRITVYELSNLDTAPKYISTPAKELILYNTMIGLSGKPGWVIWDEFWDAIGDDTSSAWFFRAIRTMRRMNCGFVGLTQSSVDITDSPHCNLLLGNMPGKLFFPDSSADTPIVATSLARLGLNPHEVSRIAGAQTGEFFYKSKLGSRLASAWLDPLGQAICASTSIQSVEAMQKLLKHCKPENLLEEWLALCGVKPTKEAA
jgi:type IV secretion system protein VirB4